MSEIEVAMEGRDDSERKKAAAGAQGRRRRRCDNIEWGLLMTQPGPPLPPGAKEGAVMEEEEVARRTERRDLDSLLTIDRQG